MRKTELELEFQRLVQVKKELEKTQEKLQEELSDLSLQLSALNYDLENFVCIKFEHPERREIEEHPLGTTMAETFRSMILLFHADFAIMNKIFLCDKEGSLHKFSTFDFTLTKQKNVCLDLTA